MAKIKQKSPSTTARSTSNDMSTVNSGNALPPSTTTNNNSVDNTGNVTANDKNDHEVDTGRSSVWKYATKLSFDKAKCNICQLQLSRKDQTTSSVRRHLWLIHNKEEFKEKHATKSINIVTTKLSPDKKRKLRQLAVNAIIEDGRSFDDLNKPGIKKLFNSLLDGFQGVHRNTVKKQLKRLNANHSKDLMKQLKNANFISLTTDFWCNRSSTSFLCLTGHWYDNDKDMVLKSKVLIFTPFTDRHTAKNISSHLEQHLKNLDIFKKTTTITCDGASNMKASFKSIDSRIKRLQCLAHKMHLIVCNALGLWIKSKEEEEEEDKDDEDEEEDEEDEENTDNGCNDASESHMRSLSSNELNSIENLPSEHEDGDDSTGENENDIDEEESEDYLPIDLWEIDVNVDPDSANDLQQIVGGILSKCRSTIKMINKSCNLSSYMENLKNNSSELKNSLSIDCKSRWNSTKFMITNVLKYKSLIGQLHSDKYVLSLNYKAKKKLGNLELTADEWFIMKSIETVLTPFENATKMMSGQQYPTIGVAFCSIRKIKSFLESNEQDNTFVSEMKDLLLEQLIHYIENDKDQLNLIIFLAYFDPFGLSVLSQKERTYVERKIKELLKDNHHDSQWMNGGTNSQPIVTQSSSSSSKSPEAKQSIKKSAFAVFLDSVSTDSSNNRSTYPSSKSINSIADEFILYKSLANKEVAIVTEEELNPDANAFWRNYGNQLPQLKILAKKFLSTPATSVPSESAFSIASNLGRRQRARLHPQTLSMTVFLKDKIGNEDN